MSYSIQEKYMAAAPRDQAYDTARNGMAYSVFGTHFRLGATSAAAMRESVERRCSVAQMSIPRDASGHAMSVK